MSSNHYVQLFYYKHIDSAGYKNQDSSKQFLVSGYIATTHVDTTGDKITKEALEKAIQYIKENKYFTVLFNHDLNRPIGKIINAELRELPDGEYGIYVDILISKTETEIIQKIEEGILNKFSIGSYAVLRRDENLNINFIEDLYIFECSIVSVPANPKAEISSFIVKTLDDVSLLPTVFLAKKNSISITINRTDIDFTPWSKVNKTKLKNLLKEAGNKAAIKECFGVVRSFEKVSDWKFPHHVLKKKGDDSYELILSYTGLMAAYKAFRGARSKPKLSSSEKESLRKHLLKHFRYLVSIGEYEEIPEGLRKQITKDITLEEWIHVHELIIQDLESDSLNNLDFLKNFIQKFNDPILMTIFIEEDEEMEEKLLNDIELIETDSILESNKEAEVANVEVKSIEEPSDSTSTESQEAQEIKTVEEPGCLEESEGNECPEVEEKAPEEPQEPDDKVDDNDNEEESVVDIEELRTLIREEIQNVFKVFEEKLESFLAKINEIIEKTTQKQLKHVVQPRGIEEVNSSADDFDFDLEEVIYLPQYKTLSIKEQLQVLRIVADRTLSISEKKDLIKNLLKKTK